MSYEPQIVDVLESVCPLVFPDAATNGLPTTDFIVWQAIGGRPLRSLDNTAGDKRNMLLQVSAWSKTRAQSLNLIRASEEALCAASGLIVVPQGESLATYEEDTNFYGSIQTYSVWGAR